MKFWSSVKFEVHVHRNPYLQPRYADMDAIKKGKEVELADHQDEIAKAQRERSAKIKLKIKKTDFEN